MRPGILALALGSALLAVVPARALETDQFYAWTQPLKDSSAAINDRVNLEIDAALERVNTRNNGADCSCRDARNAIRRRLHYPFITQIELWVLKSPLVSRFPDGAAGEELFRKSYLYRGRSPFDPVRWMPASPTIEVSGVRFGTDKLGHFFSVGAWIERPYQRALKRGATSDEAIQEAMAFGIRTEQTVLGGRSSGVLSLGDLEANYQGLLFFRGFCDGADPALTLTAKGWRLERRFDIREHVTPEWDESWQPNIYKKSRWVKVKEAMRGYCALLSDPWVQLQRAAYASRDRETPTETLVMRMVVSGKLPDPRPFGIDAVCAPQAGGLHASKRPAAQVD